MPTRAILPLLAAAAILAPVTSPGCDIYRVTAKNDYWGFLVFEIPVSANPLPQPQETYLLSRNGAPVARLKVTQVKGRLMTATPYQGWWGTCVGARERLTRIGAQ